MNNRLLVFVAFRAFSAFGQQQFTPGLKPFVAVDAPVIALEHVRILDGTGAPAREDQTIVIDHGQIQAAGSSSQVQAPAGAPRIDLANHTAIPGLVDRPAAECQSTSSTL